MTEKKRRGHPPSTDSITLVDVAQVAGVSPITVSRALNNPQKVRPATVEKVKQAAAKLGYVPNHIAGALASNRSKLIAILIPTIAHPTYSSTLESLTSTFNDSGYQTILGITEFDSNRERNIIEAILSRRPDGIIVTSGHHDNAILQRIRQSGIPLVEIWNLVNTPIDTAVGFSQENVGSAMAKHFIGKGYKRLAAVASFEFHADARLKGFLNAAAHEGITDVNLYRFNPPARFNVGRMALASMMNDTSPPEAIFFSSDILAHGALIEAQSLGLNIPEDIAIAGFGDLEFSAYTVPSITTIAIDGPNIGNVAATALLRRIQDLPVSPKQDTGFVIIERTST